LRSAAHDRRRYERVVTWLAVVRNAGAMDSSIPREARCEGVVYVTRLAAAGRGRS